MSGFIGWVHWNTINWEFDTFSSSTTQSGVPFVSWMMKISSFSCRDCGVQKLPKITPNCPWRIFSSFRVCWEEVGRVNWSKLPRLVSLVLSCSWKMGKEYGFFLGEPPTPREMNLHPLYIFLCYKLLGHPRPPKILTIFTSNKSQFLVFSVMKKTTKKIWLFWTL